MICLSLGSNIGNRLRNIQNALEKLTVNGFVLRQQSPIIETPALLPDGAAENWDKPYFNMVIAGEYPHSVDELLSVLQQIEQQLGREQPHAKWAPRIIDLDILLINDQQIAQENLRVPHPELLQRPFLIHLLALIAPEIKHPVQQKTFIELAQQLCPNYRTDYSLVATPALIGIVNVTPDSFSDGGKFFAAEDAIAQALSLQAAGASVIELGAQSTWTGAILQTPEEEYQRLVPVLDGLMTTATAQHLRLSIDSFNAETLEKILQNYPIYMVNDQSGNLSEAILRKIAAAGCKMLVMHSLTLPHNPKTLLDFAVAPIKQVQVWAEEKLSYLRQVGFADEQIILDPGIGFNKNAQQSFALLKHISQLKSLGVKLCIGHSRKSFFTLFNRQPASERDIETLAASQYLAEQGVDYLRVHNVAAQQRFFAINKTLQQ